jgi:hypothetical protein
VWSRSRWLPIDLDPVELEYPVIGLASTVERGTPPIDTLVSYNRMNGRCFWVGCARDDSERCTADHEWEFSVYGVANKLDGTRPGQCVRCAPGTTRTVHQKRCVFAAPPIDQNSLKPWEFLATPTATTISTCPEGGGIMSTPSGKSCIMLPGTNTPIDCDLSKGEFVLVYVDNQAFCVTCRDMFKLNGGLTTPYSGWHPEREPFPYRPAVRQYERLDHGYVVFRTKSNWNLYIPSGDNGDDICVKCSSSDIHSAIAPNSGGKSACECLHPYHFTNASNLCQELKPPDHYRCEWYQIINTDGQCANCPAGLQAQPRNNKCVPCDKGCICNPGEPPVLCQHFRATPDETYEWYRAAPGNPRYPIPVVEYQTLYYPKIIVATPPPTVEWKDIRIHGQPFIRPSDLMTMMEDREQAASLYNILWYVPDRSKTQCIMCPAMFTCVVWTEAGHPSTPTDGVFWTPDPYSKRGSILSSYNVQFQKNILYPFQCALDNTCSPTGVKTYIPDAPGFPSAFPYAIQYNKGIQTSIGGTMQQITQGPMSGVMADINDLQYSLSDLPMKGASDIWKTPRTAAAHYDYILKQSGSWPENDPFSPVILATRCNRAGGKTATASCMSDDMNDIQPYVDADQSLVGPYMPEPTTAPGSNFRYPWSTTFAKGREYESQYPFIACRPGLRAVYVFGYTQYHAYSDSVQWNAWLYPELQAHPYAKDAVCTRCPSGTVWKAWQCNPVPPNYYTIEMGDRNMPTRCPAGTNGPGGVCTACAAGSADAYSTNECISAMLGTTYAISTTKFELCTPPAKLLDGYVQNTACSVVADATETFCPAGYWCQRGTAYVCSVTSCEKGYFLAESCTAVSDGVCQRCAPGTYNSDHLATRCKTTAYFRRTKDEGFFVEACPPGHACDGTTRTRPCLLGTYNVPIITSIPWDFDGQTDPSGSTECKCMPGYTDPVRVKATIDSPCSVPCPAGFACDGATDPCHAGTFSDTMGARYCTPCTGNTYTASDNTPHHACLPCEGQCPNQLNSNRFRCSFSSFSRSHLLVLIKQLVLIFKFKSF